MAKPPTLDEIYALCVEDGDCLIWQGSFSRNGAPVRRFRDEQGKATTLQIRRHVLELQGKPVPKGKVATFCCSDHRCLAHLDSATRGEIISRQWKRPDVRARAVSSITKASRKRGKLDMDKARYIRQSPATLEVVSAEMGVSMTLASLIRRGLAWQEASNPFAGLMGLASNDSRKAA